MILRRHTMPFAFSLVELMIAVVFIVIAFFGYVALHSRILHSGQRLEEKEVVRAATDYYSAILVSRAMKKDVVSGPDGTRFVSVPEIPKLQRLSTLPTGQLDWLTMNWKVPKAYHKGMDQTMQLSPEILAEPYTYQWSQP